MPEIVVHQAFHDDELVGAQLYYVQDDVVHCHLGAVTDKGYKKMAFYALDFYSFEYFSGKARLLDLGGGVGFSGSGDDGLSRYKRGWSAQTQPVYFCGRITNPERYAAVTSKLELENTHYFPNLPSIGYAKLPFKRWPISEGVVFTEASGQGSWRPSIEGSGQGAPYKGALEGRRTRILAGGAGRGPSKKPDTPAWPPITCFI